MRRREHYKPEVPQVRTKVEKLKRQLRAVATLIRQEYDSLSCTPPDESATTVIYAEDLVSAINFIKRACECLDEYEDVREREAVWVKAQK